MNESGLVISQSYICSYVYQNKVYFRLIQTAVIQTSQQLDKQYNSGTARVNGKFFIYMCNSHGSDLQSIGEDRLYN